MLTLYAASTAALMKISVAAFFGAAFAILFLALEIGLLVGRRVHAREPGGHEGVSTITAAMMGLLGFTLGLTISFAQTRFEARRESIVTEANTIGTAWLRAGLQGGEPATNLRHLIETYAQCRIDYASAETREAADQQLAVSNSLQTAIWNQAQDWARANPTPLAATLTQSLNDMIDAALVQRFTFESRLPSQIGAMLLAGSILAIGAIGYQLGLGGHRRRALTSLLLAMWAGGMTVTNDLASPRAGQIRADAAPLVWTLQGFSSRH
jgi:hypothetical protein